LSSNLATLSSRCRQTEERDAQLLLAIVARDKIPDAVTKCTDIDIYLRRRKEVMFLAVSVCVFVSLTDCPLDDSESYERILIKLWRGK